MLDSVQYFAFSTVPERTGNYFCFTGDHDFFDPFVQVRFCAIYFQEVE